MKKIVLSLALGASLVMGSESIWGEFGTSKEDKPAMLSADVGLWYITWDQTSTSSDFLQNASDALETSYNIDQAPAATLELNFNYQFVSANMEYFNANGASGLGFDVAFLELIPFLNIEARYVKADFEGDITSKTSSGGSISTGTFESPLEIIDIIVYPMNKYIGIGYRSYKYEVPVDAYLMDNTNNNLVTAGLLDVSYEGSFFTLVLDNKKEVGSRKNYNGLVYSAMFGYGTLDPKTDGFDKWVETSDATFFDIIVGYSLKMQSDAGFGYGIGAGYRYNKIDTTANEASNTDNYSLMTEFNTEFHGPYVDVSMSF